MKKTIVYALTAICISGALSVSAQTAAPVQSHATSKRKLDAAATSPRNQVNKDAVKSAKMEQKDAAPATNASSATNKADAKATTPAAKSH